MNSCLADLSHLIPSNYLKKGRGRIEKTEIVEMAIKHIKYLHSILPDSAVQQVCTLIHLEVAEWVPETRVLGTRSTWRNGLKAI